MSAPAPCTPCRARSTPHLRRARSAFLARRVPSLGTNTRPRCCAASGAAAAYADLQCPTLRTSLSAAGELPYTFPSHSTGAPDAAWWDIKAQWVAWRPEQLRKPRFACTAAALQLVPLEDLEVQPQPSEVRLLLQRKGGAQLPPGGLLLLQPCCTHPEFTKGWSREWPWAWFETPVACLRPMDVSADGASGVLAFDAWELYRAAKGADRFWNRAQYTGLNYEDPCEGTYRVVFLYAPHPRPALSLRLQRRRHAQVQLTAVEVARIDARSSLLAYDLAHRPEKARDSLEPPLAV